MIYRKLIKPLFDFLISLLFLIILLPFLILIAVIIKIDSRGSILFKQKRLGKDEKEFMVYKFRTMRIKKYELETDKQRITKIGYYLRKLSIDEFPQLINILKGEMSFIGPRPLYSKYLPYYTARERLRHTVRPGISGLAQVGGRSWLTWDEQFEIDAQYVEKISFLLDISIFLQTIPKVIYSKNVLVDRRVDNTNFIKHRKNKMDESYDAKNNNK